MRMSVNMNANMNVSISMSMHVKVRMNTNKIRICVNIISSEREPLLVKRCAMAIRSGPRPGKPVEQSAMAC